MTEPNKLEECSLTLHHLSATGFADSLQAGNDAEDAGRGGVRNGNECFEEGGEFELDELELRELEDELVGEFDEDRMAANE